MNRHIAIAAIAAILVLPAVASGAPKPPKKDNQVSIAASPTRILYGRTSAIAGKITGQDHAGKTVTLQEDGYPFDTFKPVKTTTSSAGGDYTFTVQPALNTRYRVVAKTTPDVTSAIALVQVVARVSLSVSDGSVKPGTKVTFSGKVTPAHDGRTVQFQRRSSSGSWATLKTLTLADDGTTRSKYSTTLKVRSTGVYRTIFKADADHGTGKSKARTVTVS
jgi:plastocyanin